MISEELIGATLVKRYKRFLADVKIDGQGNELTVHCPNPGSMIGIAEPGSRIWLRAARNAASKLPYAWVLSELETSFVSVDTLLANKLLALSLAKGEIPELAGYANIHKERQFQESRFDFFLSDHANLKDCFLEVKSTTLSIERVAMFPDAKTERGKKHLQHLIECRRQGIRAVQFFCISRSDCLEFKPAAHIDKGYADALIEAESYGVEIFAYSLSISRNGASFNYKLSKPIPVSLR